MAMDRHHAFSLAFGTFFCPGLVVLVLCVALIIVSVRARIQQRRLRNGGAGATASSNSMMSDAAAERSLNGHGGYGGGHGYGGTMRSTASSSACSGIRLCPDVTYATYAEYHEVGNVALTISALVVSILAMWGPFYSTNLMIPYCRDMCVDPALWSLFLWLGYTVSGVSPALWFIDRDIRRQLKSLIRCEARGGKLEGAGGRSNHGGSWYFMDTSSSAGIIQGSNTKPELTTYRV